jgi:hypothetical protein
MKMFSAMVLGALSFSMATAAFAQAQNPPSPNQATPAAATSQTLTAPAIQSNPDQSVSQAHPLFTIGREPVVVWAPVPAPYDAHMNRSAAANPVWNPDAF